MNAEPHPCLRTEDGERVPLTGVSANGRLDGLLFELTVEQHYRNTSDTAIETVYTLPLPLNAVLLAFELELNGKRHVATAFPRQQAERKYENAIDDGNSAALLVDNGNGLYTVMVANLKPGEEATVRYRYAELLRANRNQVRLNLPTVIAPRYGNPADSGLEGPAIPGADLLIEYPFTLRIEIIGVTDTTCLNSPSHKITTTPIEAGLAVEIGCGIFLDRDFVLVLDHPAPPAGTLVADDGDGYVALISAVLPADESDSRPLVVKILLDCSGSMGGDSIDAAKRALVEILDNLTEADRFSLTRFGSDFQHVTEGLEPADAYSIKPVTQLVQRMDADLGGTNMPAAIQATIAIPVPGSARADVVLITDGEVYSVDHVVEIAERSGHRLFVVAIGASPNEALARKISERTGGACDFVAAGEHVEPAILRMFGRLRAAPRTIGEIGWPESPDWTGPLPAAVFTNDTIHVMAGFRTCPGTPTSMTINGEHGDDITLSLSAVGRRIYGDVLPRLAAAQRMAALPEAAARELATRYQLASEHTSLVLVAARAEDDKVKTLPNTIAVPHMLAAGWGGSSRYKGQQSLADVCEYRVLESRLSPRASIPNYSMNRSSYIDITNLQTEPYAENLPGEPPTSQPEQVNETGKFRELIVTAVAQAISRGGRLPATIAELHALCPLPEWFRHVLESEYRRITGAEAEFIRALLEHLDREEGLISFPAAGFFMTRRIRAMRNRIAVRLRQNEEESR